MSTSRRKTRPRPDFGTSEEFWINLQAQYDARIARRDLRPAIEKQLEPHAA